MIEEKKKEFESKCKEFSEKCTYEVERLTQEQFREVVYTSMFLTWDWIEQTVESACKKQREKAKCMANDMQAIAMRYNTVVSFEAIDIEFQKIFDRYFTPSPLEGEIK